MNEIERDIAMGLHSGIPACCVLFYVGPWRSVFYTSPTKASKAHWAKLARAWRALGRNIQYIACPRCLREKRFVRIHHCGPQKTCRVKPLKISNPWRFREPVRLR